MPTRNFSLAECDDRERVLFRLSNHGKEHVPHRPKPPVDYRLAQFKEDTALFFRPASPWGHEQKIDSETDDTLTISTNKDTLGFCIIVAYTDQGTVNGPCLYILEVTTALALAQMERDAKDFDQTTQTSYFSGGTYSSLVKANIDTNRCAGGPALKYIYPITFYLPNNHGLDHQRFQIEARALGGTGDNNLTIHTHPSDQTSVSLSIKALLAQPINSFDPSNHIHYRP